jgi:SAM-dependent methyltransferase
LIEASLRARGPYSLRQSIRLASDATRVASQGTLRAVFELDGRAVLAHARQERDGAIVVRADSEEAVEAMRFMLGLDADHSEFLSLFDRDPLLGPTIRRFRGLRPLRCATVTQAVLRALCGQLIAAHLARAIERRIVRTATPRHGDLHAPPTPPTLGRFAPAELRRLGLGGARSLPFGDASFDLVVSSLTVHNLGDREGRDRAIAEAYRIPLPGGRLLVADFRHAEKYAEVLRRLGADEVTVRDLGWRFWYGGPWFGTPMVTARRPLGGWKGAAVVPDKGGPRCKK